MSINKKIESSLSVLDKSQKYAVGWSGGIDSTALLLAMKKKGFDVQAWHIDHAWREENPFELEFLKNISQKIGVEFLSERLEHAASNKNKEAIARKARYVQFDQWTHETNVQNICLGHHKEDQAETVYMRLLKGSGIRGCSGISSSSVMGNVNVFRPLIDINKKDLKEYLEFNDIKWIEDPSNQDNTILRNRIRNEVFPMMFENSIDPVNMFVDIGKISADAESDANDILEQYSYEIIGNHAIKFKWSDWESMGDEVKKLFLQKVGKELFDPSFSFGKRHLNYAEEWKGVGSIDLTKTKLERNKKDLILSRKM